MPTKAKKIGLLGLFAAAVSFFAAPAVQAQINTGIEYGAGTGLSGTDIRVVIGRIIQVGLGILGVVALVLIIYAGFLWMTAGGDDERVSRAKRLLTQAVIGLAIVLASFSIASFVVSRLVEATGANGGGGGGNNGGGGPLPTGQFTVDSITPPGSRPADFLWPKNSVIRVVLRNGAPDPATIAGAVSVVTGGVPVSGAVTIDGNALVFKATAACPENAAYTCLPGNSDFNVTVSPTVRSLSGAVLACGRCSASFKTSNFIDTQNPTVSISTPTDGQSVAVDSLVPVVAAASDDSAVAEVDFYADGVLIGSSGVDPWQATWNTTGLPTGTQVSLQAKATDAVGNTALSSQVRVTVRPAHCFNNVQDGGETGLNCGDGCGACAGGSCTQNSDCASGLCQNGVCVNRPRIDSVSPLSGGPGTLVTITGAAFGSAPGEVQFLGSPAAGDERIANPCAPSAWTDTQIIVSLPEGAVSGPIQVTNRENLSDRTDDDYGNVSIPNFAVNTDVKPGICALTPDNGPGGTSVTITGVGFGDSQGAGTVSVAGRNASVSSWSGTTIAMAVPNVLGGRWPVLVTAAGSDSNRASFSVPVGAGVPHILSIDPASGPIGEYVTITGSDFGNTPGKVNFVEGGDSAIGGTDFPAACGNHYWTDTSITVKVPSGLPEGAARVGVARADGVVSDNQADFRIAAGQPKPGICRIDPASGPIGTSYEIDGERLGDVQGHVFFRDNVDGAAAISAWNAGRIAGAVPARAVTGRVYATSAAADQSNSLNFKVADCRSDKVCTGSQECCGDGTCREPNADGTSGCQQVKLAGSYRYRFSTGDIPLTPAVVEDISCAARSQSPSPYKEVIEACVNSVVSVRFTVPMDAATLTAANFSVQECGQGAAFDDKGCSATVAGAVTAFGGGQPGDDGMTLAPDADLKTNEWYQGRVSAGVLSSAGVPMNSDYVWHFRVRNSDTPCAIESVTVSPAVNRLVDVYTDATRSGNENKTYTVYKANPADAVCNELKCEDYTWAWSSDSNSAQVVSPNICRPEVRALAETPASSPATISATAQRVTGTGELTVKFVDPKVIAEWPACQDACREAQVAAQFNTAMRNISSATVKFLKCNNETCASPLEVAGYTVESSDAGGEHLAVVHPAVGADGSPLLPNTYYRVVIVGGAAGALSQSGAQLTATNYAYGAAKSPAFSWVFRTGDSHCQVDSVEALPKKIVTNVVGSMHEISAVTKTAPDDCSATGQRIDADTLDFAWSFAPNPAGAAELYANGRLNARPLASAYATAACLRSGTAAAPVCGDGIVEDGRGRRKAAGQEAEGGGEECDLGAKNGQANSGCSENCLLTGEPEAQGLCGNGTVDSYAIANGVMVREQCDLGAKNGQAKSGCSAKCLRLGSNSVDPASSCGNGDIADNEQCDLGAGNGPGTGCTSECLDEGSQPGGTSICGNGLREAGEDCDPPNGRTCSESCKNMGVPACSKSGGTGCCGDGNDSEAGKDPGCDLGWDAVSGRPLVAAGCSASCLKTGASAMFVPPSICGDGLVGTGETFDPGASGSHVDPVQFAQAIGAGQVMDANGQMVTQITAAVGDRQGNSEFDLQCGYKRDSDCPANTYLGTNTCCFPRPVPTIISPRGVNVCRNPLIEVDFDREMDASSFADKFTVTGPRPASGQCPSAVAVLSPLERFWSAISSFFSRLISLASGRPAEAQSATCSIPGSVTVQAVTVNGVKRTQVRFGLKAALDPGTAYTARIDKSVKSSAGVAQAADISWSFTTGSEICTLDAVAIDPATALFTQVYASVHNVESDATFTATPQHIDSAGVAQAITPVAGVYDWKVGWTVTNPDDKPGLVGSIAGSLPTASNVASVGALKADNGGATLGAVATITTDALNAASTAGQSVSGASQITVLLCKHPWPARNAATGAWSPYVGDAATGDARYGYSFYYCRDDADGNAGLPELKTSPTVPANSPAGLLGQYLYTYTADSISKNAALKSEGVGLRIASNGLHLSPTEWYSSQGFKGQPTASKVDGYEALSDGRTAYVSAPAVDTGSVVNGTDDFTNIFAWSYTEGAGADTKNIYAQLLKNMRFVRTLSDLNVCSADASLACVSNLDCSAKAAASTCLAPRSKVRRDVKRLADLRLIAEAAQKNKDYLGAYPQLASGSYLTGRSVSTWPSWTAAFAQDLGGSPPADPVNKLGACSAAGFEAGTCWNSSTQSFMCPAGSLAYQYYASSGVGFSLNFNRESTADFVGSYCPSLSQARCAADPWCYWNGACASRLNAVDACDGRQIGVRAATCGNGVLEAGEGCEKSVQDKRTLACSNGKGTEVDTCGADCQWIAGACVVGKCGNGTVDPGEVCDNGPLNGTYGHCNASCSGSGQRCGDGVIQQGEACDNGTSGKTVGGAYYPPNGDWSPALATSCALDCHGVGPYCGDGITNGSEQCDGASDSSVDEHGAVAACAADPATGRANTHVRTCSSACTWNDWSPCQPVGSCGNGLKETGEQCDAGSGNSDNGQCLADCHAASCGDGHVWTGHEQCDAGAGNIDPNTPEGKAALDQKASRCGLESCYYCTKACTVQAVTGAYCGNKIVEGAEQCDDGFDNVDPASLTYCQGTTNDACVHCSRQCRWAYAPFCGDGALNGKEECDGSNLDGKTCKTLGFDIGTLSCNANCTLNKSTCQTCTVNISGRIINSHTGTGAANQPVQAMCGGKLLTSGTTDSGGNYSLTVPSVAAGLTACAGKVSVGSLSNSAYCYDSSETAVVDLNGSACTGSSVPVPDMVLTPAPAPGQFTSVLTWGALPTDLDSHVKEKNLSQSPSAQCTAWHVSYGNKSVDNGLMTLDVDDTSSYGPETVTVTVHDQIRGTYYVHNYSGTPGFSSSSAEVKVWQPDCSSQTFKVSEAANVASSGVYWAVYSFRQAADGSLSYSPINTVQSTEPPDPSCP